MDDKSIEGEHRPPDHNDDESPIEDEEISRTEEIIRKAVRRRGASRPTGAFARSDWFWTWSKGVDLMEAIFIDSQPELAGGKGDDSDAPSLADARERLGSEVDVVCEAARWNVSEYRKMFHLTLAELAKAIDVSEATLRRKMNDGTLTLKEFLTICSVLLTDPCVMLGYIDSEDAGLVRNLHYLDEASDHRAVLDLVEALSHKQAGRTMIRKSVSPIVEADLGWNADDTRKDDSLEEIRRELLPDWPLWWETDFDYSEFNILVDEYLRMANHGYPESVTYEMKAQAASKLANLLREDVDLKRTYEKYRKTQSALSDPGLDSNDPRGAALESLTRDLYSKFCDELLEAVGKEHTTEEDED